MPRKQIELSVVGLRFRTKQEERAILARHLHAGARPPVRLVREPDNKFDANAVKVVLGGEHIGYLPRETAAVLAPRLDEDPKLVKSATLQKLDRPNGYDTGTIRVILDSVGKPAKMTSTKSPKRR